MAKWCGLSLDPDLHIGLFDHNSSSTTHLVLNNSSFFPNFKLFHQNNNLFLNFDPHHHPSLPLVFSPPPPLPFHFLPTTTTTTTTTTSISSTSISNKSHPTLDMESTIQFPLNLNCTNQEDDTNKNTIIHDEMDFFADHNNKDTAMIICANSSDAAAADNDHIKHLSPHLDFNVNTGLHLANTSSDQSIVDDGISPHSDDKRVKTEVAVLQAELERMNSENRGLKESLNQVTSDYTNLQMHLMTMMQDHQRVDNSVGGDENDRKLQVEKCNNQNGGLILPRQFTELGLAAAAAATSTIVAIAETDETSLSSSEDQSGGGGGGSGSGGGGGSHQHHSRTRSPMNNNSIVARSDSPDRVGSQGWGPNKVARLNQTSSKSVDQATEATMRKARVSVRARSEAPMITDGCQWRKYGQKMAKGNPCPRAYYRCTMAAGCPVRKQVQRCAEDRTILITTYEGNHTHPLPPAAMAMASTTSSAARMLLSGSMPSADGIMNSNFLARTLLPCSSNMATISASAPFPTVTLDLTQNPINSSPFQRSTNQFQLPFPNGSQNLLNNPAAALLPQIFGQALYNQSKFSGLQMSQDSDNNNAQQQNSLPFQQNPLADTVNAIASDPNFTAALAAAISSLIGSPHSNNAHNGSSNNNNGNNGSVTASNNNVMNSSFQGGRE